MERAGEGRGETALLRVPARERRDVDRGSGDVVVCGIDRLICDPAESGKQGLPQIIAEAVALTQTQNRVKFSFGPGCQLNAGVREDLDAVEANEACLEIGEAKFAGGREGQGVVEERWTNPERVIGL